MPVLNARRQNHATSGGANTSRYCYSVWLRHLITAPYRYGFKITRARIGELGPGDSIGIRLAALLTAAGPREILVRASDLETAKELLSASPG